MGEGYHTGRSQQAHSERVHDSGEPCTSSRPRREEATCHRPSTTTERPAEPPLDAGARRRPGRSRARCREPPGRRRRRRRAERARLRALARADRGPVLHPRREGAPRHHRGAPGRPSRCAWRPGRVHLSADQGRRRRHLARERRGRVLGRGGQRHGRADLPARDPAHRRQGARALQDRLPGLVSRPGRAHPRHGARGRRHRAHRAAVLPRQPSRTPSTSARRTARAVRATCATRTTRSSAAAGAARS